MAGGGGGVGPPIGGNGGKPGAAAGGAKRVCKAGTWPAGPHAAIPSIHTIDRGVN